MALTQHKDRKFQAMITITEGDAIVANGHITVGGLALASNVRDLALKLAGPVESAWSSTLGKIREDLKMSVKRADGPRRGEATAT